MATGMQFVRCIKPKELKSSSETSVPLMLEQLVASGVLQTLAIKQKSYPTHRPFAQFIEEHERHFPIPSAFRACTGPAAAAAAVQLGDQDSM